MANLAARSFLFLICISLCGCPVVRATGETVRSSGQGAGHVIGETGRGIGHAVRGTGHAIGNAGQEIADY
jgi:predicted small secreted protein